MRRDGNWRENEELTPWWTPGKARLTRLYGWLINGQGVDVVKDVELAFEALRQGNALGHNVIAV